MPAPYTAQHRLTRLAFGSDIKLVTDPTAPAAPNTAIAAIEFDSGAETEVLDLGRDLGGLGTYSHFIDNTRENRVLCRPSGRFKPSVTEWSHWLEYLMNGTPTGTSPKTFPLGTVSKWRHWAYDRTDRTYTLTNVLTGSFEITAEAGGEVILGWNGFGLRYADDGVFPASPTAAYLGNRFLMGDAAVTIGATNLVLCQRIRLSVDYAVNAERFYASFQTATPMKTDHVIRLELVLPLREHADLYEAGAGDTGVAVTITFTYGAKVLQIVCPAVRTPAPPPRSAAGDPEILLPWNGQCFNATGVTTPNSELSIILTP